MSIQQELRDELTRAMKAGDRATVNVIRQVESEIALARSATGFSGDVDDELYETTIAAYVKRMERYRRDYRELGERGAEQAAKLDFEIDFLQRWLPEREVDQAAVAAIVETAIAELEATDPKQAGRVIGHIMSNHDGLDGALVSRLVRARLGN